MSILELLNLNGLELNTLAGNYTLEAVDLSPPARKPEWAQGADSDGAELIRTPLFDNRVITATLRINAASKDEALEKLGAVVDLLQECEKNPQGSPLIWTPANSSKSITFYVLTGRVVSIPIVVEGSDAGWFVSMPRVTVEMTARPFGYGQEGNTSWVENPGGSLNVTTIPVAEVPGDVPAEGRLQIKTVGGGSAKSVEWGLESRYYNSETALVLDNESMTPVSGAQSTVLNTTAYKPGGATKGTIATTLVNEPTVCANTGILKHVGSFRVKARVQATLGAGSLSEKIKLRLSYQDGEGPLRANAWQTPILGGRFVEVDLGTISLTPAIAGTQKWLGQIEAYSGNAAGKDVLHIDFLTFVPVAEGYGRARAPRGEGSGTVAAYDNFTTGTLSGALNTRTPPIGAAWATSGTGMGDFTVTAGAITRTTTKDVTPRYGVLGSAIGNCVGRISGSYQSKEGCVALMVRFVDALNYAYLSAECVGATTYLKMAYVETGAGHVIDETVLKVPFGSLVNYEMTLEALTDGTLGGTIVINGIAFPFAANVQAVATGMALASGKVGIRDENLSSNANTRTITSVSAVTLPAIVRLFQTTKDMEVRWDSTIMQDPTGTYWGSVPVYRGSRLYVPQAGSAKRSSRVLIKTDYTDVAESDETEIRQAWQAQIKYVPRYLVVPR